MAQRGKGPAGMLHKFSSLQTEVTMTNGLRLCGAILLMTSIATISPLGTSAEEQETPTRKQLTQPPSRNPVEQTADDLRELSREREQAQDRERMHDTSHDRRLKVGPNTSVTVDQKDGAPIIDLKHTTP